MWGKYSTGIGNYIQEISIRLFAKMPNARFVLFLPRETFESFSPPPNVEKKIAEESIYSFAEQCSFCWKLWAEKADLTFFPHFNRPLLFRGKSIVTIHDLTILHFPGKKKRRFFHRIAHRAVLHSTLYKSEALIAVSKTTKKEIIDFFPRIPSKKTTVISNGIDINKFQNPDIQKVQEFQKKYGDFFLVAGVWREHKNVVGALAAFELYKKHGGQGNLVITGRPDPFYPEVPQAAQESEFSSHIFLTNFIPPEEMPALLSAASALIFPSFAEGFGLPLLEAMAGETPALASNIPVFREVANDAALFFDPHDPESIALEMVEVFRKKTRDDLIAKGEKRVQDFSWEKAATQTAKLFEKFL